MYTLLSRFYPMNLDKFEGNKTCTYVKCQHLNSKYAFEKKITESLDKLMYMDGPNVFQLYLVIERFRKVNPTDFSCKK